MSGGAEAGAMREQGLEHEVKVINLSPERVSALRKDLSLFGAEKTFDGEVENIRIDNDARQLTSAGINARVRKYTSLHRDGSKKIEYEWTVKRKVKNAKFKSREESKGAFVSSYEEALSSLNTYVSEQFGENVTGLQELWRVKKHREMYEFPKEHSLGGTEVVIDKLIEVSVGGVVKEGSMPVQDIPHYMEIESSTGDEDIDNFNITECGALLDVDIAGELHDASERELLEHYGFLEKKKKE